MNNKNIIIAGAIAIGLYLFSQTKKIQYTTAAQKVAQKVAPKRIGQPTTWAAYIAAARKAAIRKAAARKIAQKVAQKVAQRVVKEKNEYVRERARPNIAIPIRSKKIARKIPSVGTSAARKRMAKKIEATRNRKIIEKRIAAQYAWLQRARKIAAQKAAARKAAAQKIGKIIGKKVAQKVAQKKVASWKAPYRFPNSKVRVITPSYLLKKLAKKDIARKKAVQQKKVQKTTPGTPSDRRKSRLKALYGSHWHDIWIKRQKRR